MMLKGTLTTCIILLVLAPQVFSEENLVTVSEEKRPRFPRLVDELSKSQDSRSFGYSIEGDGQQSSHFRKEQRDLNGVVRGSYGLKDPNGSFRLVRYIADDKGFRAHVSSNEHGVGRQDPASVRISRFEGTKDASPLDSLYSTSTQQSDQYMSEEKDLSSNYNFYTPVSYRFNEDESNKESDVRNPILSNQFIDHISRVNEKLPVGTSGSFTWPQYNYGRPSGDGNGHFDRSPFHRGSFDSYSGDEQYDSRTSPLRRTNGLPSSGGQRNVPSSLDLLDERHMKYPSNALKLMLQRPPLKVHTSLPDCDKVNSGVLCKPPLLYASNYLQYNSTLNGLNPTIDKPSNTAYRREMIETTLAERLYRFAATNDEVYPSHTLPSRFGLQDNIQKAFPGLRSFIQKHSCEHNNEQNGEGSNEDLSETNTLSKPVIYNTISNTQIRSVMKYDDEPISNPMRLNYDLLKNPDIPQQVLSSQNYANKARPLDNRFIFLTSQNDKSTPEQSFLNLFKNMNVLGFIILPQETDSKDRVKSMIENPSKTLAHTIPSDESYELDSQSKDNKSTPQKKVAIEESTTAAIPSTDDTNPVEPHVVYETSKIPFLHTESKPATEEIPAQSTTQPTLEAHINSNILLNNSRFLILDEKSEIQGEPENNSDGNSRDSKDEHPPHDWRKQFTAELGDLHEKPPLPNPAKLSDESETPSNASQSGEIPNERVYSLNEPHIPIYDSRGNPIKSENVPLHLHRYVPPTGRSSFPWKFSIPRPAPPRSIVMPPKPPILS